METLKKYLIIFSIFISSCGETDNYNQSKFCSSENIQLRYSDSGEVKKFFDENWTLVYDSLDAKYYRIGHYNNGQICKEFEVMDYYISGKIQFRGYLIHENPDTPNGSCTYYYSNGKKSRECKYKDGKLIGKIKDYFEAGEIKAEIECVDGSREGTFITYYENGNVESYSEYINNQRNGSYLSFYENGSIKVRTEYRNGLLEGEYFELYPNGQNKVIGVYYEGQKHSTWSYIDSNGSVTQYMWVKYRVGAICRDGWHSYSTGRGTCSHHGGVDYWLIDSSWELTNQGFLENTETINYQNETGKHYR